MRANESQPKYETAQANMSKIPLQNDERLEWKSKSVNAPSVCYHLALTEAKAKIHASRQKEMNGSERERPKLQQNKR